MYPRAGRVTGIGTVQHSRISTASKVPVCKCLADQLSSYLVHTPSFIIDCLAVYKTGVKKEAIAG